MGITLAVFKGVGYIPEEKERLKMSTRFVEIYFWYTIWTRRFVITER